ncbi:MAG: hypothetical protein AAF830_13660, partial [Pseudomonadota bacterium]
MIFVISEALEARVGSLTADEEIMSMISDRLNIRPHGARLLYSALPKGSGAALIGDKGVKAYIQSRRGRMNPAMFRKETFKQLHNVKNMFGRLKDWRGIAAHRDRSTDIFRQPSQGF